MSKVHFLLAVLFATSAANAQVKQCPLGEHWVRAHSRRAYIRTDGTHVRATNVVAHCHPDPKGYAFWKPKIKNGKPPNWPHKNEISQNWTTEEQERLLESLAEIPSVLWSHEVSFYRMKKSKDHPNDATYGENDKEGIIVLYNNALDFPKILSRTVLHELAHEYYRKLSSKEKNDYAYATNWAIFKQPGQPQFLFQRSEGYVQPDGKTSVKEDFANNVEYFAFEPNNLKKITPQAHRWMEHHFSDKLKIEKR